jgi:hypothetical protein
LPEQAKEAGAHVFRIRGSLQAAARSGGWDRLAEEICLALEEAKNGTRGRKVARTAGDGGGEKSRRHVFVVCGRDSKVNSSVYDLLRALNLQPYEWEQLVVLAIEAGRGGGNPNVFDVVEFGFEISHGAIVLFSPDDEARLCEDLRHPSDAPFERELARQPRPNVLLEAGYALRHDRDHTLLISVGNLRPMSDVGGMHILHLANTSSERNAFAERLRALGFDVDTTGRSWLSVGDFS